MSLRSGESTPGEQLSELLAERKMSRRQFSLALAREREVDYETAKSSVYKWLRDAHTITGANRPAVAKILGIREDEVPGGTAGGIAAEMRDLRTEVREIRTIIQGRGSWMDDVDQQLKDQTRLLAQLSELAAKLVLIANAMGVAVDEEFGQP